MRSFFQKLCVTAATFLGYITFWDVVKASNSLLLFGEPEYPFED